MLMLTTLLLLGACTDDINDHVILDTTSEDASIFVHSSDDSVVLLKDNIGQDALTISWNEPDFGVNTENPSYQVIIASDLTNYSDLAIATITDDTQKTFEVEELNTFLTNNEIIAEQATDLQVKIIATIGSLSKESDIITINLTTYADKIDLSTNWGIVGSATPNSWDGPDIPFYETGTPNEYVAYATFIDGDIKIRKDNAWDVSYGDANLDGILDTDSDNDIAVTAGTYKVLFNETTLAYSIEAYTWEIVGSATANGWDGPDLAMTYDSTSDTWKALVALVNGVIKIRQNNTWDVSYGDANLDGILDTDSDNDIAVTAGNYLVTVNTNTLEYSIEAIDVWGIVGDATPNQWDGPDTKFNLDFSQEGVWYLNDMVLTDGQIKFRTNDDWSLSYGDATLDGILDGDDNNNILVTAGVYDFTLDFSNPNTPTYTLTKQ